MGEHRVRVDLNNVRFFHGGVRRLKPGDIVQPPSITGAPCASDYGAEGVHRRDRVYLTIDINAARFWAAMYAGRRPDGRTIMGRGDLYEVEPLTALEHDPDAVAPGYSFQVGAARVARVIERFVTFPDGVTPDQVADMVLGAGGINIDTIIRIGQATSATGRPA